MRILIVGLIVFLGWSALSTYTYVCIIKGLCDAPISMQVTKDANEDVVDNETIQKSMTQQVVVQEDLVVYFAFDKSDFSSNSASDNYFDESVKYLNQHANSKISIIGYTDAIGTKVYNQSLGYRRALVMQRYFENKGMPNNKIIISSNGENSPIGQNNTKAGRAENRRTVITIKNQ